MQGFSFSLLVFLNCITLGGALRVDCQFGNKVSRNRAPMQLSFRSLGRDEMRSSHSMLPERLKGTPPGAPNSLQHLACSIHIQAPSLPLSIFPLSPTHPPTPLPPSHTHTHTHIRITTGSALRNRQPVGILSSGSGCAGPRGQSLENCSSLEAAALLGLAKSSALPQVHGVLSLLSLPGKTPLLRPQRTEGGCALPRALCSRINQMTPGPGRQKLRELPRQTCLLPKAAGSRDDLLSKYK